MFDLYKAKALNHDLQAENFSVFNDFLAQSDFFLGFMPLTPACIPDIDKNIASIACPIDILT